MSNLLGRVPIGGGVRVTALGPIPNFSYSLVGKVPGVKELIVVDRFRLGEVRREVLDNEVCCLLKGFLVQIVEFMSVALFTGGSLLGFVLGKPLLDSSIDQVLVSFLSALPLMCSVTTYLEYKASSSALFSV